MARDVRVRDLETDKVVRTITTELVGRNYDQFVAGLGRKVDLERFYLDEDAADG